MKKIECTSLFVLALLIQVAISAQAHAVRGACGDRPLPRDKTRKLHHNSVRLECSSQVDHYIRTPEPFGQDLENKGHKAIVEEWMWLEEEGKPDKMQVWRQKHEKVPMWKGTIPYQTIEKWTWEEWVFGHHHSCPVHEEVVTVEYQDEKGNTRTRQEVKRTQPPCWHDEERYESRFCSEEAMTFDAEFIRPSLANGGTAKDSTGNSFPDYWWNPTHPDYHGIIPSRYDLLPGEFEDVQIYSNRSMDTSVTPEVKIGDAWNKYDIRLGLKQGGRTANCEMRRPFRREDLHVTVRILAMKRDSGKTTPNALRANGVDTDGNKTDPLVFNESLNRRGKLVRTNPYQMRLTDSSNFIIEAMARQSRSATAEREVEKAKLGEGSNTTKEGRDKVESQAQSTGFYKDTRIRVAMYEKTHMLSRDIRLDKIYRKSGEISDGGQYKIGLEDANDSLFKIGPFQHHLKPARKYDMRVAMYNHGVPFYRQEYSGINALENWFSDELVIPFETSPEMKDKRGLIEKHVIDHANAGVGEKWSNIWDLITFKWLRQ